LDFFASFRHGPTQLTSARDERRPCRASFFVTTGVRASSSVTTGLDPVVYAAVTQAVRAASICEPLLSMDYRVKPGNDDSRDCVHHLAPALHAGKDKQRWSRDAFASEFCRKAFTKRPPQEERRSAERRIQPMSARRYRVLPLDRASGAVPPPYPPPRAGDGWEGARLPALHRSDRTLQLSLGRASRKREGAGVTRAIDRA
jgi:hypothetical protein